MIAGDGTCENILLLPANFCGLVSFTITSNVDTSGVGAFYMQFYADNDASGTHDPPPVTLGDDGDGGNPTSKYGFSYLFGATLD